MRNLTTTIENVIESGSEDVGASILRLNPREAQARRDEAKHKAAEIATWNRDLDRQRIIAAALRMLENRANAESLWYPNTFIAATAGLDYPNSAYHDTYVSELLAEIRAELSPIVRTGN